MERANNIGVSMSGENSGTAVICSAGIAESGLIRKVLSREGRELIQIPDAESLMIKLAKPGRKILFTDCGFLKKFNNISEVYTVLILDNDKINKLTECLKLHSWDDFLIIPVTEQEISKTLRKADQILKIRKIKKILETGREEYYRSLLDKNRPADRFNHWNTYRLMGRLIHNLRTAVTQGKGPGMLVSLLGSEDIQSESVNDLVRINIEHTDNVLLTIQKLDNYIRNGIILNKAPAVLMNDVVNQSLENVSEISSIKNVRIIKDINTSDSEDLDSHMVLFDRQSLTDCITELLTNAVKFSPDYAQVFLILAYRHRHVRIDILNIPDSSGDVTGIPPEFESLIFEPFFRISHHVKENLRTNDYGLGLSIVKAVAENHGGHISIYNVRNHLSEISSPVLVNAEFILPYADSL